MSSPSVETSFMPSAITLKPSKWRVGMSFEIVYARQNQDGRSVNGDYRRPFFGTFLSHSTVTDPSYSSPTSFQDWS